MALFVDSISTNLVLMHEDLCELWGRQLPLATDKGYPKLFDDMVYWVLMINGQAAGHTGSLTIKEKGKKKFVLVGNTYMRKNWRGHGLHSYLLNQRNNSAWLKDLPKITILNPIEDSTLPHLAKVVSRLGYKQATWFPDVRDIMTKETYLSLRNECKQIWRLG